MPRISNCIQLPDGIELGLWSLSETSGELLDMAGEVFPVSDLETCRGFKSERRRCEWLASRFLILDMIGHYAAVAYDDGGKPYLPGSRLNISISHTDGMVAVLLSGSQGVAIDIERLSPRILRIQDRFLHQEELRRLPDADRLRCLYIHWCAKEAMYKAFNIPQYDYQNSYAIDYLDSVRDRYSGRVVYGDIIRRFDIINPDVEGLVVCVAVLL